MERMLVRGVTGDNDIARIAIMGVKDEPGIAFRIFSLLSKHKINVDIILQSIGRDNKKDISFTVSEESEDEVMQIIKDNAEMIGAENVTCSNEFSKVSIVGAGMVNNPGVAAMMFEALFDVGVNIHMISTSESKISVLVKKANAEKAVRAIHEKFDFTE